MTIALFSGQTLKDVFEMQMHKEDYVRTQNSKIIQESSNHCFEKSYFTFKGLLGQKSKLKFCFSKSVSKCGKKENQRHR